MTVCTSAAAERRHQGPVGDAAASASVLAFLRAVVAASECLVAEPDLQRGVDSALDALRTHTRLDRVYVFRDVPGAGGVMLFGESHDPRVGAIRSLFGNQLLRDEAFAQVLAPLRAGTIYQSIHPQRTGENADVNEATHTRSDLMVPVLVHGAFWGIVGFDDCRFDRSWSAAEVQALQGAAVAIAAAVSRSVATLAQAEDAAALALRDRLLAAVALTLDALLGSAEGSFEAAVGATLSALGRACGIHRVKVLIQRPAPDTGEPTHYLDYEWWAPGLQSQTSLGLTQFPDALIGGIFNALKAGHALWWLIDDVPIEIRSEFARVGVKSVGAVPVFGGGQYVGSVAFDDCVQARTWSAAEIDALTCAARTIGGAIHRHQLQQDMLAERDRRIELERLRAEEAEAANAQLRRRDAMLDAVARMSRDLLPADGWMEALPRAFERIARAAGIQRVALTREGEDGQGRLSHRVVVQWCAMGVATHEALVNAVMSDGAAAGWMQGLHNGLAVWCRVDDMAAPLRPAFSRHGVRSTGWVPIVVNGSYWGAISFDDCRMARTWDAAEIDSLTATANAIAAAIARQHAEAARLSAQRLRADDTEEINRLLEGVVAASQALLEDDDFDGAMGKWLSYLATAVAADRAQYGDDTRARPERSVTTVRIDWTREGLRSTQHDDIPASSDFVDWSQRLAEGQTIWAHRDELVDPVSVRYWQSTHCWTNLIVPVVVDRQTVGWLCFDFESRREWKPALGSVLRTAADGAAAAIKRRWAVLAMLAERDKRVEVELARADEAARHARVSERHSNEKTQLASMLELVVRSSRALIDAADFEPALARWLGEFGRMTAATRATFYDFALHEESGQRSARMLREWVREGVDNSIAVSFDKPYVIDPRGAEDAMARLMSGQIVYFHLDETQGALRDFLVQQGNATVIAVPIFVGGTQWGCLSFDFATKRHLSAGDVAVLQTAADTLAAILRRNDAMRATLAERESRIAMEQRRFSELADANDALRVSLDALAGSEGEEGFLRQSLLQICAQAEALAVYLFHCDAPGSMLRLAGSVSRGVFSRNGLPDDPPMFQQGFAMVPALLDELVAHGRLLWRRVDPATTIDADTPESIRWHVRLGHKANALHALMVGGRQVGLIGMVFDDDRVPSQAKMELMHTLCQPLTLSLELSRLGRQARLSAEQAAVLSERDRMAAEIHDSLAQSFTSIAMQSESLAGRMGDDTDSARVLRLIERTAREGLVDARTSVLALRRLDDAPGALDQALSQLAERSSIRGSIGCSFEARGAPCPLSGTVRESLLRIAQEATSNAMRHSGGREVRIALDYAYPRVRMVVADDGVGVETNAAATRNGGFGMSGMKTRALAIGATFEVKGSAAGGTAICVEVSCSGLVGPRQGDTA